MTLNPSKPNTIRTWALSKWRAYGGDVIETDNGVYIKNADCVGELNTALHCLLRLTILEADA
jgi:hypothetical protein